MCCHGAAGCPSVVPPRPSQPRARLGKASACLAGVGRAQRLFTWCQAGFRGEPSYVSRGNKCLCAGHGCCSSPPLREVWRPGRLWGLESDAAGWCGATPRALGLLSLCKFPLFQYSTCLAMQVLPGKLWGLLVSLQPPSFSFPWLPSQPWLLHGGAPSYLRFARCSHTLADSPTGFSCSVS